MNFPYFFIPQYSVSNAPQINTYPSENVRLAEAISVNFADFLPGALVTDGSVNYTDQVNSAIDDLSAEYLADGFERMLTFPAGFFRFTGRFLTGVGLRGAGVGNTLFRSPEDVMDATSGTPINRFVVAKRDTNFISNNVFWDFEINQDHIPFSHIATYGLPFYNWKCIAWDRVTDSLFKGIKCGNTLGTSIGIDVMNRVYLYDVESYNAGNGVTTTGESGPGAGFGITSGTLAADEVLEFHRCKAWGSKTGGFYFERALIGEYKPTGHLLQDCEAYDNYLGIDNNACTDLIVNGGRYHHNSRAGYHHGANRTTNFNQGPKGGTFTDVEIDNNCTSRTFNSNAIQFGYSINRSPDILTFDNCDIHSNSGNAFGAVGDGLLAPNDTLRYGEAPKGIRLINGTRVANNAGGAIVLANPKNNSVNASSITASEPALLAELTIDSTVVIENNNRAVPHCEVAEAISIGLDATNINIAGTFKGGDAQRHAIALRGNYSTDSLTISGDLSKQSDYAPIIVEHTVTATNNTATLDATRPTSLLVTNHFIDPQLVGATMPTMAGATGAQFTQTQPIAGLTQNYRLTTTDTSVYINLNALVGDGFEYGERFTFSFYAKTNNATPIRCIFENTTHTAGIAKQASLQIDDTWKRYSFSGVYMNGIDLRLTLQSIASGVTVDLQGLMLLDATIQPDYFDGGVNGGAWSGTANASLSTKTVSV